MATTNECPTLLQLLEQDVFDLFFGAADTSDTSANNMGGATELADTTLPQEMRGADLDAFFLQAYENLQEENFTVQSTSFC